MENRFTVKDFFLFSLLIVAIVMVGLSMKQFDRQFSRVVAIEQQNANLTRDITSLRDGLKDVQSKLEHGISLAAPNASQTSVAPAAASGATATMTNDPFVRVREARGMKDFEDGDWLVYNLPARIGRMTPFVNEDVYGSAIRARCMETLLTRDPDTLKFKPLLAESYEMSKDGLELRYKLRRNVVFSDGTPFTADDVIFTFDWIMNPGVDAARLRSYYVEQQVSWQKVNDYEVLFRMKKPYFEFMSITGDVLILSKNFYSKYTPAQYNELPGLMFGSGPYRLRNPGQWSTGERIELVRNDRYWGVKPAFNRIIFTEVEEEAVGTTMFQNGEIDVMGTTPDQHDRLKKDAKTMERGFAMEYPNMLGGYTYVGWNQLRNGKPTAFADKRVRQAMTMLVDRERMAQQLWRGYASVSTGPFSKRGNQAAPELQPWAFDPQRAKAQLAQCGFADHDNDGVLEGPDGKPFSFSLMYPSKSEVSQRIALFLKDSFARAGVQVELKPTDWPTMLQLLKQSEFDACTLGWSSSVESDLFQIFHSSQIGDGGDNRTYYINKDLDKLIGQARSTVDEDERMKIWQQCTRIIHEDQPYTFLLDRLSLRFSDKRIANTKLSRMGLNLMYTEVMPIPWYSSAGMHKYSE
ncbi:MAG: ABC transporter substrate-binding protein [Tepidisphaeraceae bacterium]